MRVIRFGLWTLTAALLFAADPKVAPDLANLNPEAVVDVIIQYKRAPTPAHHAIIAAKNGLLKQEFQLLKGALYTQFPSRLSRSWLRATKSYIFPRTASCMGLQCRLSTTTCRKPWGRSA